MASFAGLRAMRLPSPRQFGLDDIETGLQDLAATVEAQATAFRAHSQGRVSTAPVQSMGQPPFHPFLAGGDAQTCVKSGYIEGDEHYVIKIAPGGVRENEERGLPVNTGLNLLFSQRTARLEAIFFDEGLLTEIRTAAAAALAARVFAPRGGELRHIGMLGSGIQARWQLRLLAAVTPCRSVLVHARDAARVASFCEDMATEGWTVRSASLQDIAENCQLIHTTTTARAPLLQASHFANHGPVHINATGADVPTKQELDPALVASADLLVCDCRKQTVERGEFREAAAKGLVASSSFIELGDALDRPDLHRASAGDGRLTVFDSSGIAAQDIVITKAVYEALMRTSQSKL